MKPTRNAPAPKPQRAAPTRPDLRSLSRVLAIHAREANATAVRLTAASRSLRATLGSFAVRYALDIDVEAFKLQQSAERAVEALERYRQPASSRRTDH